MAEAFTTTAFYLSSQMAIVNKFVFPFTYRGSTMRLDEQMWTARVAFIYKSSENGAGWVANKIGGPLPAFDSLENGETYVVVSKPGQLGYEIPEDGAAAPTADGIIEFYVPPNAVNLRFGPFTLQTSGLFFREPKLEKVAGITGTPPTMSYQLDNGTILNREDFNTALANIPLAEIKAGLHEYTIIATSTDAGAVSLLTI